MTLKKRLAGRVAILACSAAIVAAAAAPVRADGLAALSPTDAKAYAAAFDATERGDFIGAQMQATEVQDHSLLGYLSFHRLMHPTAHVAAFDELSGWLAKFRDLPMADRIFALASKRRPDPGAEAPRPPLAPPLLTMGDGGGYAPPTPLLSDRARRGREAFFSGDVLRGLRLSSEAGDRWITGLASWRLKSWTEAERNFAGLAGDSDGDAWQQAAAWYWAARAADAAGDATAAASNLRAAARNGETFYGMLAARQLKLAGEAAVRASDDRVAQLILANYAAPSAELAEFVAADPRAHRAAALAQIGRGADAIQELRAGMALARTSAEQAHWRTLTLSMGTSLADRAVPPRGDDLDYPTPDLQPRAGFTLDRALVYAIVRQESRFNPQAISQKGAIGLMQLMPNAALAGAGDDKLRSDMTPLFDPGLNLQVGQDYFAWLFNKGVGHDLIRAVAAYNAGPSPVARTAQMLGDSADPLLLMESLPAGQTRAYVQHVLAGYWTYRRMWGQDSPTLDALASGDRRVDERLDLGQPGRPAPQLAAQAFEVGAR